MREGYLHIRFADAFNLYMGKTPDRDNSEYWKDGIRPWVAIADMKGGKYITDTKEKLPQIAVDNTKIHCVKEGTVIMSFKLSIGKTAIAPFDLYTNEAIMAFEPKEGVEVLPDWLYYYLPQYQWNANKAVKGTTINKNIISNAFLDIPSFSTQELIVRELDSISSVISAKKQQVLELDNLAQAIFLDTFGDPITNPKGWEVKRWEDAVTIINGRNQAAVECEDGQYPICGSGGEMGRANEYLSPEFSIIIGRKGNINKPILMREKFWNIDTAFGIVPITDIVNADYLYHFCLHFDFELLNVTVTIPSLRKADLLKIRIPLPPLSLQQAFAEKVQAIEEQKRLINQSIAEFESLLAQRMEFHFA